MFQARKDWEFQNINGMLGKEIKSYRFVSIALHIYIFWVEQTVKEDEVEFVDQTLLYSIHDLIDLTNHNKNNHIRINLVSPSHSNDNGEISMAVINEIYRVSSKSQIGHLYNCSNGKSYFDSFGGFQLNQHSRKELLYQYKAE